MNNTYKTNKTDWRRLVRSILFVALLLAALPAAAQVSGGKVTLDDREPHTWSYYSDASLPEQLRSLNPADVQIIYHGNGKNTISTTNSATPAANSWTQNATTVQVSHNEADSVFIYHKTLERTDGSTSANPTGRCKYTTIANPFSKRPTYQYANGDLNKYCGFYAWRVVKVSGGTIYDAATDGNSITAGSTINAEQDVYFAPTASTGMVVELEALWARAYVVADRASYLYANGYLNSTTFEANSYERNFYVLTGTYNSDAAVSRAGQKPVTITARYPDGTAAGTNSTINRNFTCQAATKFEYVTFNASNRTLSANGKDLVVGRGCTGTVNNLYGLNAASTSSFKMRIESGTYNNLYFLGQSRDFTNDAKLTTIMGSDYDRAKVCGGDATYNEKLRVTADIGLGYNSTAGNTNNKGAEIFHCTVKSGNFDLGTAKYAGSEQFYISVWGNDPRTYGKRTLIVEGGIFSDIAGGMEQSTATQNVLMVDMRIKGGTMNSVVYGAAQKSGALGHRRMIITGGLIKGWIAGGANGNSNDANSTGEMVGNTYIYVGGNTEVNSNNSTTPLNRAVGGNVFAAGCGWGSSSNSGLVTGITNVAIADNALIERGVYGGGSYGYTTQTSNIYILGGIINGRDGGVNGTNYLAAIDGGVYGGACQNQGGTVNLTMSGGTVNGSIYGGSNYTGNLSGTSTVTLNGGTVNGSIYGGGNGEGNPTNVDGAVQVTVNGGTVTGAVYGCGNVSGAPQSTVNVDVYGTDPQPGSGYAINQVFGGGNAANYSGTPVVTVHDDNSCDISIEEVYGGGNAATVRGTDVTVEAGNRIGNVFGGCYGANVTNDGTKVNIKGGTIEHVYGGNNQSGTITGAIRVRAHKDSDCPMKIGELYGGGNMAASNVGSIDIGCTGTYVEGAGGHDDCNETDNRIGYELEGIHEVYGGANQANITGNINLTIDSGMVYRVFGGNNNSGSISGTITVNIGKVENTCGWYVGYVYGGGFNAPYSNAGTSNPSVNVTNGLVSHSVFGGGKGNDAVVTGNPLVTLSNTAQVGENVYGGGDAAPVTGNTSVILKN